MPLPQVIAPKAITQSRIHGGKHDWPYRSNEGYRPAIVGTMMVERIAWEHVDPAGVKEIDGDAPDPGSMVLLANQDHAGANGVWVYLPEADMWRRIVVPQPGQSIAVAGGATYSGSVWHKDHEVQYGDSYFAAGVYRSLSRPTIFNVDGAGMNLPPHNCIALVFAAPTVINLATPDRSKGVEVVIKDADCIAGAMSQIFINGMDNPCHPTDIAIDTAGDYVRLLCDGTSWHVIT